MNSELLAKQIEAYSNAIVAFAVLQGLAYSYYFGTNPMFNCLVKTTANLAVGLSAVFVVVTLLSVIAIVYLGRIMREIAREFAQIVQTIYRAKLIAVILFSLLPLAITAGYGVRDYPGKAECKTVSNHA